MAYATQVTISTGNKVSLNYQSQEVSVTLTYQLEREDTDVLALVQAKAVELAQAHRAAWQTLRDAKVSSVQNPAETAPAQTAPARKVHAPEKEPIASAPVASAPKTDIALQTEASKTEETKGEQTASEKPTTEKAPTDAIVIEVTATAPGPRITPGQLAALLLLLTEAKWSEQRRHDYLREKFSCQSMDELSAEQAKEWLLELQRAERESAQKASEQRRLEKAHRNGTP